MIAEHREPKLLPKDAEPILDAFFTAHFHDDAVTGSAMLRDAILEKHFGIIIPKPPKPRPKRDPIRLPEPCPLCGAPAKSRLMIAHIQAAVSSYYGLPLASMTSAQKALAIARPRQVAMYLASQLTPKSLPEIGRRFGNRDHTTVIHAIRAVKRRIAEDPEIEMDVEILRESLIA